MVSNSIDINKNELLKIVNGHPIDAVFDSNVDIDALSGASKIKIK